MPLPRIAQLVGTARFPKTRSTVTALESMLNSINSQVLGQKVPHPPSTNFNDDFHTPSPKRLKRLANVKEAGTDKEDRPCISNSAKRQRDEIPDSEDEDENDGAQSETRQTQLESALPLVKTDAEAIEAYEAYKAGEEASTLQERMNWRSWTKGRSSIYVDAFNLALDTVLEEEGHLFDEAEKSLFEQWRAIDYEAQYLYVRLFLRKTSAWHRIAKLGYYSDIADLPAAVVNLQQDRQLPRREEEIQSHPGELEPPEGTHLEATFKFAECSSDHISTLDEAGNLLLLDELKTLAKEAKINGKNKRELLANLRQTSGKQRGLGFRGLRRSDTEESTGSIGSDAGSVCEDQPSDGASTPATKENRDAHFLKKILDQTGKCIRLAIAPLKLFERVHLVFYRSTEWTEKSLTTLILAKISRRNFPEYVVSRSSTIFESRSLLLEFEASLRTQFHVDSLLEFNGTPGRRDLEEVKAIFEAVHPRWQALLAVEQQKEDRVYESGEGAYLRRFSPAWVYTRIVHKGLHPLARFKEHLREHRVLSQLLSQHLFHAARRGMWYQRKALLEEHYMFALEPDEGRSEEANKKHWKRIALRTCEEGLEDRDCHIIYHYDLQKRIKKLEKQLKLPRREQHDFGHVLLGKPVERSVQGIQIIPDQTPLPPRRSSTNGENTKDYISGTAPPRKSTKTVWLDELDSDSEVSVEAMCLSHYRKKLGWKGYHSEGGILRTLFGLLFHDVLFAYVPNVFQTAYQTCPLDLHSDAFYSTRISEINALLNDIANGKARETLTRTWDAHFERKTCIVGVRWEDYEFCHLIEIVCAFPSDGLAVVMRVLAQEYAGRGGGVPDLFLWKAESKDEQGHHTPGDVMFAEVKSENDRLSDTQRLWISVLLNAGIKVELCHAVAKEVRSEA